jgi:hypothetical protein
MSTTRLTFSLDAADAAALVWLAQRYQLPVAALARDAVRLLLADPATEQRLQEQLLQRYAPPTPAQAAASERLIADAMQIDLSALLTQATGP